MLATSRVTAPMHPIHAPITISTFEAIHEQYTEALAWMKGLGVSMSQGRTADYERVLRHWKTAYATATIEEANSGFGPFVSAALEVMDFIQIHKRLRSVDPAQLGGLVLKLSRGVKGPSAMENENANNAAPRNFLFEAVVTALGQYQAGGMEAQLDAETDAGVHIDGRTIRVECKRVLSEAKLEKNLKVARDQLNKRLACDLQGNELGIIVVDATRLINPDGLICDAENDSELKHRVVGVLREFADDHMDQVHKGHSERRVAGTMFRLACLGRSREAGRIVQCNQWIMCLNHAAASSDRATAERYAKMIALSFEG